MAGLDLAIHVFWSRKERRGCPRRARAWPNEPLGCHQGPSFYL